MIIIVIPVVIFLVSFHKPSFCCAIEVASEDWSKIWMKMMQFGFFKIRQTFIVFGIHLGAAVVIHLGMTASKHKTVNM